MKNLLLLLKVDLMRTFSLNKLKENKNILKTIAVIILVLFILSSLIGSVVTYAYLGTEFLIKYGLEQYLLPLVYLMCSFTVFYTSIYRSKAYLFNCEDNLFAMPIKPSTILTSRVIVLMLISFIPITLIFIPFFITYGIMLKLGMSFYVYSFLGYLFMPIMPTILGSIFGYFIGYLSSKVNNKRIFETILTYAAVLLVMYLSMNIQNLAMKFVANIEVINKILENIGFLINSFMRMLTEYSLKDFLVYAFFNILSAILFIAIFKKTYVKIMQNLKVEKTNKKYIEKEYKTKGRVSTLLHKELKMYFSIPIYVLNTSFGVVILMFASVATLLYDKATLFKLIEIQEGMVSVYAVLVLLVGFVISMSSTTACSISIEGKNFWILKTMPIKTEDIFISKVLLHMLIVIPLSLISIVILGLAFELAILQILSVCILAILINITTSLLGIIANLKYPRLDFPSYTHVVKQSISTFIGIMLPLAMFFVLVGIYAVLKMPIDTYVLIVCALLLAIIVVQYYILKKWGIERFNEIN